MKKKIANIFYCACAVGMIAATISCDNANAQSGDFEYREIYLPDPPGENSKSLGLNNLDDDWGIWGHNLNIVLPGHPDQGVYASMGENIESDQYCFSSDQLFGYICDYIDNNFLFEGQKRFAILPNDNDLVCQCDVCVAAGNTPDDASPAVFNMIDRLAKKYPKHLFFTSYYLTTKGLPKEELPHNVGVLISAMDYPLTTVETPQEAEFMKLIESWAQKTDRIYIWDYVNNFDDYFTPFPIIGTMQRRLQKYQNAGVTGVFMNGSGADFSTFSDIKKVVMAQLLKEPDTDWRGAVRDTSAKFYPETGDLIAEYIIGQEDYVSRNGKTLPMYEGITAATNTYLDEAAFVKFYDQLEKKFATLTGKEKESVSNLLGAMAFTRLELMRKNGDISGSEPYLQRLKDLPRTFEVYNEACWPLDRYIAQYKYAKEHADEFGASNLLKGVKLVPRTKLDEDYSDISILTDGVLGIPSNYHSGNMISSADPSLRIEIPRVPGMTKLRVWLVRNRGYHIFLPESVSLNIGDLRYATKTPPEPERNSGRSMVEFDIPSGSSGNLLLTLTKDPEGKTMAIDEIEAF